LDEKGRLMDWQGKVEKFELILNIVCPFCKKHYSFNVTDTIEAEDARSDAWGYYQRAQVWIPQPEGWVERKIKIGNFEYTQLSCAPDCEEKS